MGSVTFAQARERTKTDQDERESKAQLLDKPFLVLRLIERLNTIRNPQELRRALLRRSLEETKNKATRFLLLPSMRVLEQAFLRLGRDVERRRTIISEQWRGTLNRPYMEAVSMVAAAAEAESAGFLSATEAQQLGQLSRKQPFAAAPFFTASEQVTFPGMAVQDRVLGGTGGDFSFVEETLQPAESLSSLITREALALLVTQAWVIVERMGDLQRPPHQGRQWAGMAPLPLPVGRLRIPLRIGNREAIVQPEVHGAIVRAIIDDLNAGHKPAALPKLAVLEQRIRESVETVLCDERAWRDLTPEKIAAAHTPLGVGDWRTTNHFGVAVMLDSLLPRGLHANALAYKRPAHSFTNSHRLPLCAQVYVNSSGAVVGRGVQAAHRMFDGDELKRLFEMRAPALKSAQALIESLPVENTDSSRKTLSFGRALEQANGLRERLQYQDYLVDFRPEVLRQLSERYEQFLDTLARAPHMRDLLASLAILPGSSFIDLSLESSAYRGELKRRFTFHAFMALAIGSLFYLNPEFLIKNAEGQINPALMAEPEIAHVFWLGFAGELSTQEQQPFERGHAETVGLAYVASFLALDAEKALAADPLYPGSTAYRLSAAVGGARALAETLAEQLNNREKVSALQRDKVQVSVLMSTNARMRFLAAAAERYAVSAAILDGRKNEMPFYGLDFKIRGDDEHRRYRAVASSLRDEKLAHRAIGIMMLVEHFVTQYRPSDDAPEEQV